jgi:4-amino-4-deoxy-L-arabinose transferase-like glycosyltransferase
MESLSAQPASWGHSIKSPARTSMRMAPEAAVTLLALLLFVLRLAAPENLLDQDQIRPATYVLDILKNGNWLCQRDLTGEITSKPPLYTWVC